MQPEEMNRLVESVTQEVLRALGQGGGTCSAADDGRGRVLVLGDASRLPKALFDHRTPVTLEDYRQHGSIARYEQVVIQSMTTLQMGQLALGLPADDLCRAVMDALLNGIEVCLCEECLWHRKYAGRGSTPLYQLLEGYVRQLQVFGVKSLAQSPALAKPTTYTPPIPEDRRVPAPRAVGSARPNYGKLVTERLAHELCEGADGALRFEKGTLITPAARDVFAAAGVTAIVEK